MSRNPLIRNTALPKYPVLFIIGEPVTRLQALDIILRTDLFLTSTMKTWGGNDHAWNDWYWNQTGLDKYMHLKRDDNWHEWFKVVNDFQYYVDEKLGSLTGLEYIRNDWASCNYVGGPHGFVHPDGKIWSTETIGKYPSPMEVLDELKMYAKAFPYLDMYATLATLPMDENYEKYTEYTPLITFRVKNGKVIVRKPENVDKKFVYFDIDERERQFNANMKMTAGMGYNHEHGLDEAVIAFYIDKIREITDNYEKVYV